jgi:hypothetical protein
LLLPESYSISHHLFSRALHDAIPANHEGTKSLAKGRYFLDSVLVSVPQMVTMPENLHSWLKSQDITANENIYCKSQIFKRKMTPYTYAKRFL